MGIIKRQIRIGVFETNSSSIHSLVILSDEEYEKYRTHELFINKYGETTSKKNLDRNIDEYVKERLSDWDNPKYHFLHQWHKTKEEYEKQLREDAKWDYDLSDFDILHKSKIINGIKVHALSIDGYDG